jgi:hypothetical protein
LSFNWNFFATLGRPDRRPRFLCRRYNQHHSITIATRAQAGLVSLVILYKPSPPNLVRMPSLTLHNHLCWKHPNGSKEWHNGWTHGMAVQRDTFVLILTTLISARNTSTQVKEIANRCGCEPTICTHTRMTMAWVTSTHRSPSRALAVHEVNAENQTYGVKHRFRRSHRTIMKRREQPFTKYHRRPRDIQPSRPLLRFCFNNKVSS